MASGATLGSTPATSSTTRVNSAEPIALVPHTRIDHESKIEEFYQLGNKLGQGSFGVVRMVTHKETNTSWACKGVNKEKAGSSAIKLLEREVAILKKVRHEHIIKLREVFETPKKMYLVTEYCGGGELADVLREKGHFGEPDVKTIITRLTSAIAYLHRNDMVHRDLKLENVLLAQNPADKQDDLYIKVTDFGLSVVKDGVGHDNMLVDFCGTPMYMAPEIIDNKSYSERCDVWAIGVIMFLLMCGAPPFHCKDEEELYKLIKEGDIKKCFEAHAIWLTVSEDAKDCLSGMLAKNPAYRLTCLEVLDHPWITGGEKRSGNVLELMKEYRKEMTHSDEEEGISNGKNHTAHSSSSASGSMNSSNSHVKNGKAHTSHGKKGLPRISTDPTLSQTARTAKPRALTEPNTTRRSQSKSPKNFPSQSNAGLQRNFLKGKPASDTKTHVKKTR